MTVLLLSVGVATIVILITLLLRKDAPKVSGYSLLIGLTRQKITPFFPKNLPSAAMQFVMR